MGDSDELRIWAVVAARMGSERLPGKSMALLAGAPSLEHIIERLRESRFLQGVTVATTVHPEDEVIRQCGQRLGVPVFSGSSEDVLDRTLRAARAVSADIIVQVTGDCPLIDASVCDEVIEIYLRNRPDYACNVEPATYPNGLDTEVFATSLLAEVAQATNDPADREHVTLYIRERPAAFRIINVEARPFERRPELRLTLDTLEDYQLISAIYDALYASDPRFGLLETLEFLDAHPDLLALNRDIQQKPVR